MQTLPGLRPAAEAPRTGQTWAVACHFADSRHVIQDEEAKNFFFKKKKKKKKKKKNIIKIRRLG